MQNSVIALWPECWRHWKSQPKFWLRRVKQRLLLQLPLFGADNPPVIKARCLSPVLLRISGVSFDLLILYFFIHTGSKKSFPHVQLDSLLLNLKAYFPFSVHFGCMDPFPNVFAGFSQCGKKLHLDTRLPKGSARDVGATELGIRNNPGPLPAKNPWFDLGQESFPN